jgi:hypothetical protein
VVAYPTLLFMMPLVAVLLALALGERTVGMLVRFSLADTREAGTGESGRRAWRALSLRVLGGLIMVVPFGVYVLSFGVRTLERRWTYTIHAAQGTDVLGGAPKAVDVARGVGTFLWSASYLLVALVLVYLVFLKSPRAGRALLALIPFVLWKAGQEPGLHAAGFVIVYAILAPYLYLFLPRERREAGARMLVWVWGGALLAGAMTAFTSSAGYANAAVGLPPPLLASGLFLAWALEAVATATPRGGTAAVLAGVPARTAATPWLALVALLGVVAVTLVFQVQFQQEGHTAADLTRRCDFGP